jgi:large subunit ribosomal protein L25
MKLNVKIRNNTGEKESKELRRNNQIPAVLYGKGFKSIPLAIDYKEFYHFRKHSLGHRGFVFLKLDDREHRTLIKEIQIDPLSRKVMHIDFQEIYAGQKIEASIPIRLLGDAPGVMEGGGIMDVHLREVNIKCLPKDLPDSFEIDISHLQIGDSLKVEDIAYKLPNLEILTPASASVLSIILPKVEVTVAEEEEEAVVEEAKEQPEEKEETEK